MKLANVFFKRTGFKILEYFGFRRLKLAEDWFVLLSNGHWGKMSLMKSFKFALTISFVIQGPVIENISHRCGGFLKYLSLKGCQSVGDQSIRTLAQHCHNIEHLDLTECKKISDAATEPLSKHCNKLTSVSLESCSQISDLSLKSLSDGCPVSCFVLWLIDFA